MLRKIVVGLIGFGCTAGLLAQQMPVKVAVIDVDRVIMESSAGKEVFKRLQKLQQDKFAEAKQFEQSLAELEKKLSEQRFVLSEDKLTQLRKQYEDKRIDYDRFKDDSQRDMDESRKSELQNLEKKIMPIIDQMGREGNYALIFNKYNSGLVFAADSVDITDEVLLRFNTQVNIPPPAQ